MLIVSLIYLVGISSLVFVWLSRRRRKMLTPIDIFMLIMLTQYGPHCLLNTGQMDLSRRVATEALEQHRLGLAIGLLALSFGMLVAAHVVPPTTTVPTAPAEPTRSKKQPAGRLVFTALAAISAVYIALFLAADGPGLPRLTENVRYFLGTSEFTYTEIRRQIFADGLYEQLASRTRFSITPLLFSGLVAVALTARIPFPIWLPLLAVLYGVCASQLSKFPLVYFTALAALTYALSRSGNRLDVFAPRMLVGAGILGVVLLGLFYALYQFQYAAQIDSGILTEDDILELLWYRPLFVATDSLTLWFAFFPRVLPFVGFANIELYANLLDLPVLDPTELIPDHYVGFGTSTFQTGFIGSGYAAFGFTGIAISGVIAGAVVWVMSEFPFRMAHPTLRTVALAVLSLNTFFLTTRQLHTALLSGGVISTLVILAAVAYALELFQGKRTRRMPTRGRRIGSALAVGRIAPRSAGRTETGRP